MAERARIPGRRSPPALSQPTGTHCIAPASPPETLRDPTTWTIHHMCPLRHQHPSPNSDHQDRDDTRHTTHDTRQTRAARSRREQQSHQERAGHLSKDSTRPSWKDFQKRAHPHRRKKEALAKSTAACFKSTQPSGRQPPSKHRLSHLVPPAPATHYRPLFLPLPPPLPSFTPPLSSLRWGFGVEKQNTGSRRRRKRRDFSSQHRRTPRNIEARARSPPSTDHLHLHSHPHLYLHLHLHLATARPRVPQDTARALTHCCNAWEDESTAPVKHSPRPAKHGVIGQLPCRRLLGQLSRRTADSGHRLPGRSLRDSSIFKSISLPSHSSPPWGCLEHLDSRICSPYLLVATTESAWTPRHCPARIGIVSSPHSFDSTPFASSIPAPLLFNPSQIYTRGTRPTVIYVCDRIANQRH